MSGIELGEHGILRLDPSRAASPVSSNGVGTTATGPSAERQRVLPAEAVTILGFSGAGFLLSSV